MLTYAVISFAAAALGGLVLASYVLRGHFAPWGLSLAHAGLGALGLVFVAYAILEGASGHVPIALAILVVAALGGFYLAWQHMQKKIAPSGVVLVHAGAAVVGFLLLCNAVFGLL